MEHTIYLDHNATTPMLPAVASVVVDALATTGNPSSVHEFGRASRGLVEDARERVAALAGADPSRVIFTSGGTEANNLALRGRQRFLVSAVEHPSVLRAAPDFELIPVNADGVVNLEALEAMLETSSVPAMVSVMLANNETGVIQPVAEVARLACRFGAMVHCDAVQAAAWVPISKDALGVHMLSLSAHKIGGPRGVGALVVSGDAAVRALVRGGGQERGRRAGTENVPGIAGFGAAAGLVGEGIGHAPAIRRLRDDLERRVRALAPEAFVFGSAAERLPNTVCMATPGISSETQVISLDLAGVAVSAGAACSSGKVTASHVLAAMGVADDLASSAIRVSLGRATTAAEVERFVGVWSALRARVAAPAA
jgi:cysteine desulfurase